MTTDLVIIGCGGFGREVADIVDAVNIIEPTWNLLGFLDDAPSEENVSRAQRRGSDVLGTVIDFRHAGAVCFVVGVGSPKSRRALVAAAEAVGLSPATMVHPTANVGASVRLGVGTVVAGHVDIGADTIIGAHVHLDRAVQVGHDSTIEDFATAHPAAVVSGACRVGTAAELGTNCTLLPTVELGAASIVGAGACVTADVLPGATVKGVPAR